MELYGQQHDQNKLYQLFFLCHAPRRNCHCHGNNLLDSLTPSHKDYHPIYFGALEKRDAAYHQGTSWGFLLGGFISAYVKVNGNTKEAANEALEFLAPVKKHLAEENCIGSICEIFDGDAPHFGRGCYAQAWSVGEVLRCYTEDILPNLS